jgi:hypothetical protein
MNWYELLGPVSIIWLWACLFLLILKWPGNISMTFSEHATKTRASILYYLLTFSTHLALFYIFIVKWFVPTYSLPTIFTILMSFALLGEFVALLIPATGGRKTVVHQVSSFFMLALLVPISGLMIISPHFPVFIRVFAALVAFIMVSICLLFTLYKNAKQHQLIYQVVYGGSFHLLVLLALIFR